MAGVVLKRAARLKGVVLKPAGRAAAAARANARVRGAAGAEGLAALRARRMARAAIFASF